MPRLSLRAVALGALLGCWSASARAMELDAAGKLRPTRPGALVLSFDDVASLVAWDARETRWVGNPWEARLVTTPVVGEATFGGARLSADDVPEGFSALTLGGATGRPTGVLLPGKTLLAKVGSQRFSLTFWAKSAGATSYLTAGYGAGGGFSDGFARVVAIRSGRETSDGWTEFTTGTIDADVWGVPLSGVLVATSPWAPADASFALDALEIVPEGGSKVAPVACTQTDVESTCGAEGDCQYGHCIPGFAAWGPLPSRLHREQLVQRWIHLATRIQGDRNAKTNAKALISEGSPLAWYATSPRPFFSRLQALVNKLRDQHTQFGYPSAGLFFPVAFGGGTATTGACFGPGQHDLLEGKPLGYVVYGATKSPVGVDLAVGDALTAIDGVPPLEWVKREWVPRAGSPPNDPAADLGWSAQGLSWMLEKRAHTLQITRCAAADRCTGTDKQVFEVNVADPMYEKVKGTGSLGSLPGYFWCSVRFRNALDKFAPGVSGENTVSGQIVRGDVLAVQFDGTYGLEQWSPSMRKLFEGTPPTKVLFDTRQGNGGHGFNSETVVDLLRPASQPIAQLLLPSAGWDGSGTIKSQLNAYDPCISGGTGSSYTCLFGDHYLAKEKAPPGASARVAFLDLADVSANDFLARLVKGRTNLKIYGLPTSGAFGSISGVPPMLVGWGGGSIQMQDSLFAGDVGAWTATAFESGKGVPPDVVGAQKMSDALRGRDTLLEAAHAWLAGGPDEGGAL